MTASRPAISEFTNTEPEYTTAPGFAYGIGEHIINKGGNLTGPENPALLESLREGT